MDRRIHPSLLREPLFWGVPRHLLAQELILVALPLQLGFSWRTLLAAAFWGVVVHSSFRYFHSRDPQALEILVDMRNYHRHYVSQALAHSPSRLPPWRSVPRHRPWH